jgi:hypothetical protein
MSKPDIMTPREFNTKAQNRYGKLLEPNSPDEERAYKNAAEVLSMIRDGTLRASELSAQDRRPVVAYLRLEGYSKEEMSRLFEINVRTIAADLALLSKDRTKVITKLSLLEVAGRLYQNAKHLARKARREGSYSTAWKIEKELVQSLQDLGLVYRAPKTLGIATLHANLEEGHTLLKEQIGEEKDQVVSALGSILGSLKGSGRKLRISHDQTEKPEFEESESTEFVEIGNS